MRARVVLAEDLVKEIDERAGPRQRRRFVEEAVRERLRKDRLLEALEATAGSISAEDHPEWATSEDVARWVRKMRGYDD